jgi:hypothetical protein
MIQVEYVTLDKSDHKTRYELQRVEDIVLDELALCDPDNAHYYIDGDLS